MSCVSCKPRCCPPVPSAGEVRHLLDPAGVTVPMVFLGPPPLGVVAVNVAGTINPVSAGFSSPALGELRYDGPAPALFSVSYEIDMAIIVQGGGPLYTALTHNSVIVAQSYWFELAAPNGAVRGYYGQALLLLKPGDVLRIGVGGTPAVSTTIQITSLSIVAK